MQGFDHLVDHVDHIDRYDWVILGGTEAARQGAQFAATQGARVALVEPPLDKIAIAQLGPRFGQLMRAGVDVVLEDWLWERSPITGKAFSRQFSRLWSRRTPWLVRTETRWLWGDRYLDAQPRSQKSHTALQQTNLPIYRPETLNQYFAQPPRQSQNWAILGGDITAITHAQTLARRGDRITLLLPNHCLVSGLFNPADRHLQNILEADGIDIVWDVPFATFTAELLPPNTDQILVATLPPARSPDTGPRFSTTSRGQAITSPHLQTSLPYFYIAGPALGGYTLPTLAESEVLTAIAHGLGHHPRPLDYGALPWTIPTTPAITQWGKTLPQKNRPVIKLRCDDGGILWALLEQPFLTTQWQTKWRSHPKLVGAAGVGDEAQQAIATLAILGTGLGRSPSLKDILHIPSRHHQCLKDLALTPFSKA